MAILTYAALAVSVNIICATICLWLAEAQLPF
jgi:hypothetical protein